MQMTADKNALDQNRYLDGLQRVRLCGGQQTSSYVKAKQSGILIRSVCWFRHHVSCLQIMTFKSLVEPLSFAFSITNSRAVKK